MAHQHEDIIKDFREAMAKLVPLAPKEIQQEARQLADDIEANPSSTVEQIVQALVYIGKKEFPYRKAYEELCAGDEEARLQKLVLAKLDDAVKEKMESVVKYGVHILDFVQSSQYELALNADERSIVDREIAAAHDVLNRQCDERAVARKGTYETLVAMWTETAARIQSMIDVLKGMAERNEQYTSDILARVATFEAGWSMIEPDPTEEDVQKDIAYWSEVLSEDGNADDSDAS